MVRQNDALAKAIAETVLKIKVCEPFVGLVTDKDNFVTGCAIINNYDGRDCHLTGVYSGAVSRRDILDVCRYVFDRLKCERITAVTRETNEKAIGFLERLGFKREGTLRKHFPDSDGLIFGLLKSECPFLRNKNGQPTLPA